MRPGNGVFFEVIPQRPVAQHLEEGQVGRVPYFIDIPGADAFLAVREPDATGVCFTKQVWHQGMHTRRGEQYRGIILRDQGCPGNARVPLAFEEAQVHLS